MRDSGRETSTYKFGVRLEGHIRWRSQIFYRHIVESDADFLPDGGETVHEVWMRDPIMEEYNWLSKVLCIFCPVKTSHEAP